MQAVKHNLFHLNVVQQLPSLQVHAPGVISNQLQLMCRLKDNFHLALISWSKLNMGFIKNRRPPTQRLPTHRPTDHLPLNQRPTDHLPANLSQNRRPDPKL